MEHQLVDKGVQPQGRSTPRHTPKNCFRPINPPKGCFSSIKDTEEYAFDISDISDTPCVEWGAAAPRSRSPHKRPANNLRSSVQRVVAKQPAVDNVEKRFASLSLLLRLSSVTILLNFLKLFS